ncbi:MAG TPA: divalent metal cation transporter [Tepidisphaeraceae bacterium]|jgi:NRAMP (natural resistance-associated macrophage protein)-like metal ion transporter
MSTSHDEANACKSHVDIPCAPARSSSKQNLLARLGPGLITGGSDDDPSGIATYSQAGAAFGYGMLWTILLSLPLMVAIQEISARIGRISGHGIAGNIRRNYPAWLLYPIVVLLMIANTINVGADIGAMGDAAKLLVGGNALIYSALFAVLIVLVEIFGSYQRCCTILKYLCLVLLSYILTSFFTHVSWSKALHSLFIPHLEKSSNYWATFVAVFGTTISPYLFFWQAAQETEEIHTHDEQHALKKAPEQAPEQLSRIRFDTIVGMSVSNVVAFFIIVAAAATLHVRGVTQVDTSAQAADALRPIAGKAAFILFAVGIIGTGLLAVPVLAGSAAYAMGEAFHWPTGMDRKPLEAKGFYAVLSLSTLLGLAINFPAVQHVTHLSPIQALFWSAVINGVTAVPIMVIIMLMAGSKKVMGEFERTSKPLQALGWLATLVMAAAAVLMFVTIKSSS